ncbi:unnamed protein product [Protopolystoma xenopodis]|uniref:Uncharacterized protein n=1 Tax=Protopolystoma xenopodis TaxID=117903 RepID=A0A448X728_9PLAT|nr:unnamed protein product [Protopolystoma xenopodis]
MLLLICSTPSLLQGLFSFPCSPGFFQLLGLITFIVGIVVRVTGSFGPLDSHLPAVHEGKSDNNFHHSAHPQSLFFI